MPTTVPSSRIGNSRSHFFSGLKIKTSRSFRSRLGKSERLHAVTVTSCPLPEGRPKRAVCTSEARKIRVPLARARGSHPQRTSHLRYKTDRGHALQRRGRPMVPQLWAFADDAVCPGKRVVSWINACSSCRATRRTRCPYQSSAGSLESPVRPAIAG